MQRRDALALLALVLAMLLAPALWPADVAPASASVSTSAPSPVSRVRALPTEPTRVVVAKTSAYPQGTSVEYYIVPTATATATWTFSQELTGGPATPLPTATPGVLPVR